MHYKKTLSVLISCLLIVLTGCLDNQHPYDRDYLIGFIDKYFEALVTQDPGSLPLAKNVRYTENGQLLELGDGMWGPANAVP